MIDILNALNDNEKEARNLLKGEGEVMFAKWDEEKGVYVGNDDEESSCDDCCPYIRYSDDDGNIVSMMVVGVRLNEDNNVIEIIATDSEYKKSDDVWFPLAFADDISEWSVYDRIGEMFE